MSRPAAHALTLAALVGLTAVRTTFVAADTPAAAEPNLAVAAVASTSFVSGHETLTAVQNDFTPDNSNDKSRGAYGNWPERGRQWVQYAWAKPVHVDGVAVYWFDDGGGVRVPASATLQAWRDGRWQDVKGDDGQGLALRPDTLNTLRFPAITTDKLRIEMTGAGEASTGILVWKVRDAGGSPAFPPVVTPAPDRTVLPGVATDLSVAARSATAGPVAVSWEKASGPGDVTFTAPNAADTDATLTTPGRYVLRATARVGRESTSADVVVRVSDEQVVAGQSEVLTRHYALTSPLWKARTKALIVNWIPHCVAVCDQPNLKEGGINNVIAAADKNAGKPARPQTGYPFANAWLLNTIESMCVAQALDPQGDPQIAAAQAAFRKKLDQWIPLLLAAQEPDGYFQTRITLGYADEQNQDPKSRRWNPALRAEHEGYVGGYFIEAGIAHHVSTDGRDTRLYNAAKKLADCWYDNLVAKNRPWYDGHEEMEQACYRLSAYVDRVEGPGKGDKYAELARFLLDCRGRGERGPAATGGDFFTGGGQGGEYDQSHRPVTQQYRAVGHAVRAVYLYSAMAAEARRSHDPHYRGAIESIWDNLVNKNMYLTGGVGSGETSEGFGKDYSLPNNAYCESCAGAGMLFFQHQMNLLYGDAKYADLYENVIYNALLSDIDLGGRNFTYTNSLDTEEMRYKWHVCPCCVGNIPRVLLSLPTWAYARRPDGLAVNLFLGSTMSVPDVAGTDVTVTQTTDYPWNGKVTLKLTPRQAKRFVLRVRVPRRDPSALYTATPEVSGLDALTVNGQAMTPKIEDGYALLDRTWSPGDTVAFTLPMAVQRVKADPSVKADRGKVALRFGPLVYNFESVDQPLDKSLADRSPVRAEWSPGLLDGVMTLHGTFSDGTAFRAVPNYARNNRGGRSLVWIGDAD